MAPRGTSAWRAESWGKGCDPSVIISAYWLAGSGKIQCHRDALGYFRAVGRIMRKHRYVVRRDVTGCYVCRPITGGTAPSAHAQGIALDVNWDTNPYRLDKLVTDMPRAMVEEIEALTTITGLKAGRWGGDWDGRPETAQGNYDAMHFELMITPAEARPGAWSNFWTHGFDEADQWAWPLVTIGERGNGVKQLQLHVNRSIGSSLKVDGFFGEKTDYAVKAYQKSRGLEADGIVSLGTWTAILTDQPALPPGAARPGKVA
jgi:hypothetical protein